MHPTLIYNAIVVTLDEVIPDAALAFKEGVITEVFRAASWPNLNQYPITIDAHGSFVFPGIIDLHTDAIEKEISPRPGANFPVPIAFRELERRMCASGITLVYHSIYLGYYAVERNELITRRELFNTIGALCQTPTVINNRIHLRYEITGIGDFDTCIELIEKGYVQLLSFMDHTPGQGQYGMETYVQYLRSQEIPEDEIEKHCYELLHQPRLSTVQMQTITDLCQAKNIPIASHDDDSPQKVMDMQQWGATISEFPINETAAQQAVELGLYTIGGASNVLRGGSLGGNLQVQSAIEAGLINVLGSDYYPPAMLHAVFKLYNEGTLSLPEALKLVTHHPAKAMGIDRQQGDIAVGKNADVIVVKMIEDTPVVTHVFIQGKKAAEFSFQPG